MLELCHDSYSCFYPVRQRWFSTLYWELNVNYSESGVPFETDENTGWQILRFHDRVPSTPGERCERLLPKLGVYLRRVATGRYERRHLLNAVYATYALLRRRGLGVPTLHVKGLDYGTHEMFLRICGWRWKIGRSGRRWRMHIMTFL